jgi:HK97 family phage portal protein
MGIVGTVLERRARVVAGEPASSGAGFWARWLGAPTYSGINVDEHTALNLSTVWACIRAISEDVAKLPLKAYVKEADGTRTALPDHDAARIFNDEPNEEANPIQFRETILGHCLGWGNGYAEIEHRNNGRPLYTWNLEPHRVFPDRTRDGRLFYVYHGDRGKRTLEAADVIHVAGLGYDGVVGYSPVAKARESMGMALAAERFGSSFFRNSARPSGALETPVALSQKAYENLKASWRESYQGSENAGSVPILEQGTKFNPYSIAPNDAQFLETRQFQVPEICRWYRMKPHKVADLSRATFSNIEHESLDYVVDTLLGWMVRIEQEVRRKLRQPSETRVFFEHVVAGLLRGDLKSRYAAYAIGRQWGWESADSVLSLENRNPLPDGQGKLYLVPANMTTPELLASGPRPSPSPAGALDPAGEEDEEEGGGEDGGNAAGASGSRGTRGRMTPAIRRLIGDEVRRAVREGGGGEEAPSAAEAKLVRAVLAAHRPMLAGALRGVLKVEADKARRAENKGELRSWAGEFYHQQPEHVRGAVWPVLEVVAATLAAVAGEPAGELPAWVRGSAMGIARRHADRSGRELAAEGAKVAEVLARWEGARADEEAGEELDQLAGLLCPAKE